MKNAIRDEQSLTDRPVSFLLKSLGQAVLIRYSLMIAYQSIQFYIRVPNLTRLIGWQC